MKTITELQADIRAAIEDAQIILPAQLSAWQASPSGETGTPDFGRILQEIAIHETTWTERRAHLQALREAVYTAMLAELDNALEQGDAIAAAARDAVKVVATDYYTETGVKVLHEAISIKRDITLQYDKEAVLAYVVEQGLMHYQRRKIELDAAALRRDMLNREVARIEGVELVERVTVSIGKLGDLAIIAQEGETCQIFE
jgi:hypothetical protein